MDGFRCIECGVNSNDFSITNGFSLICEKCRNRITSEMEGKNHIFTCKVCGYSYDMDVEINRRKTLKILDIGVYYLCCCPKCGVIFDNKRLVEWLS